MQVLTDLELDKIEFDIGYKLPKLFRKLLLEIGFGQKNNIQIYHPSEIYGLYNSFFEDPSQLFRDYFPFGCNNQTQSLLIIDPRVEKVSIIGHETVPEDWDEELWVSYDKWCNDNLPI